MVVVTQQGDSLLRPAVGGVEPTFSHGQGDFPGDRPPEEVGLVERSTQFHGNRQVFVDLGAVPTSNTSATRPTRARIISSGSCALSASATISSALAMRNSVLAGPDTATRRALKAPTSADGSSA